MASRAPLPTPPMRPRVVVLGCGFGGFSLLSSLRGRDFDLTLVSPRNYFLFTPLLPSAVSGTVEFRSILEPARPRLRHVRLIEASAETVDWSRREVACRGAVTGEAFTLPFDRLVIAVGAEVSDFGVPGVREHALELASVEDARAIRRGVLRCFAAAEIPGLPAAELRNRLTVVVCGGGPTGVEVAAEIQDLLAGELLRGYPELAPLARVVLVEAAPRLLGSYDAALSAYAAQHFRREGIEVRTGTAVTAIGANQVELAVGPPIAAGLVIWAGGNAMVPLIHRLRVEQDPRGRIRVDDHLRVAGHDGVYALGDCACSGEPGLPATAQVAQQQGKYLARALRRELHGKTVPAFRFRAMGMLAYIGGGQALADLPQAVWSGRGAWLFWRSVYLTKLVSFGNKVKVLFDWAKASLLGRDLSRF
jgi:NADH:quinone reductase (non-electrogenic)